MNTYQFHSILRRYRKSFQEYFTALDAADIDLALQQGGTKVLDILAERYGYEEHEARAAWNDFVLRYVDGREFISPPRPAKE